MEAGRTNAEYAVCLESKTLQFLPVQFRPSLTWPHFFLVQVSCSRGKRGIPAPWVLFERLLAGSSQLELELELKLELELEQQQQQMVFLALLLDELVASLFQLELQPSGPRKMPLLLLWRLVVSPWVALFAAFLWMWTFGSLVYPSLQLSTPLRLLSL